MTEMTDQRAAEVLAAHNEWRRFKGETGVPGAPEMGDPAEISRAIDHVVSRLRAAQQPAAVEWPCRLVDGVVTVNGIALDEVVRLGDRYAATIEKRGMPRAAQVFEALVLIGKHALAAQQPAAEAQPVDQTFAEWLATEMPAGTVIGDPAWWAGRIARQYAKRTAPPSAPVGVEAAADVLHKLRRLALVIREHGTCAPLALDHIGDDLERALAQQPAAAGELAELVGLLDEVRSHFTRDDDLPDDLLPRIDAALAAQPQENGNGE